MQASQASPWKRADLHLHTSFSGWRSLRLIDAQDCYVAPDEAFAAARARGMDYVCFTDHNTIDGAHDFLARHPEHEPRVIVGEEIETTFPGSEQWIHLGVLDVDERLHEDLARLRPDCYELIAELERRGRFFVLNHPFQSFRTRRALRRHLAPLLARVPAVEVVNSTSPASHARILPGLLRDVGRVGGSDAHTCRRIGAAYTTAPGGTKHEFLDNLKRGTCAIGGGPAGLGSLVRDVYTVIGQYYARLSPRRPRSALGGAVLLPAVLGGVPALLTLAQALRQEWVAR
ncbi:MAG TPA: PHP-associated domain-containing protein, partial [Candidatus Polarisedimenticolaceae bacterium]|nr:PHP-associated domain-containing protein [Candidatus Polarisedimenticolaceae bacterium]